MHKKHIDKLQNFKFSTAISVQVRGPMVIEGPNGCSQLCLLVEHNDSYRTLRDEVKSLLHTDELTPLIRLASSEDVNAIREMHESILKTGVFPMA